MLSFILPAHNEEALLPETLRTLRASAAGLGVAFEVVVVDDDSTDATAAVAASLADRVVRVRLRHIAAVRNAGARQARGDVLVFVDADTLVPAGTLRAALRAALRALGRGAVGGGAWVEVDPETPWWGKLVARLIIAGYAGLAGWAGGCFLFARRGDFEAVGGFDERYFASEEAHLSAALRRRGRFAIVRPPVITSGRKFRLVSPGRMLEPALRVLGGGLGALQRREGLSAWYGDGLREPRR
jgi:glycosyltransferase involved in cell wall biosynthesis